MTKRRFNPGPTMKEYAASITALALDELNDMRISLGREHAALCREANVARNKLDVIKNIIFHRKNGGEIGITDHAVLRYLERHKGVDVRAARDEISELIRERKAVEGSDGHFNANGIVVVIPQGSVVATVMPASSTPPR